MKKNQNMIEAQKALDKAKITFINAIFLIHFVNEDNKTVKNIANKMGIQKMTAWYYANQLIEKGFLKKKSKNKRVVNLELTLRGKVFVEKIESIF